MKLLWLKDTGGWGRAVARAALDRGHQAIPYRGLRSFVEHRPDWAFWRLSQETDRLRQEKLLAELFVLTGCAILPQIEQIRLYEDKAAQAERFISWMPATIVVRSPEEFSVRDLVRDLGLPFVSKSANGAASINVRLITTLDQAETEFNRAFSRRGMPIVRGPAQKGYLIWQKLCAGNDYDYRINRVGPEYAIFRRWNRDNLPFASGSGRIEEVNPTDDEPSSALEFAQEFLELSNIHFGAIDLVWDNDLEWRLLETSVGWTTDHEPWQKRRFVSGRPCSEFFDVIVDMMEEQSK
jgi:hypothetical protein